MNHKRKYEYPITYIKKNGTLNKNKKKSIYIWRRDIQKNHSTIKGYNKLKLENFNLKENIKNYIEALECWVLLAQNN